jgi:hypothetical protein
MFRFTIRELVLLTIIVAMAVGWWVDREQLDAWHRRLYGSLVSEVNREGFWIVSEDGHDTVYLTEPPLGSTIDGKPMPKRPLMHPGP